MVNVNLEYLEKVKQDLVDDVESSPFIVPMLLSSVSVLPAPRNFVLEFHKDKVEKKIARRRELNKIVSSNKSDYMSLVKEYQEKEFLEFLKVFPNYASLKS